MCSDKVRIIEVHTYTEIYSNTLIKHSFNETLQLNSHYSVQMVYCIYVHTLYILTICAYTTGTSVEGKLELHGPTKDTINPAYIPCYY